MTTQHHNDGTPQSIQTDACLVGVEQDSLKLLAHSSSVKLHFPDTQIGHVPTWIPDDITHVLHALPRTKTQEAYVTVSIPPIGRVEAHCYISNGIIFIEFAPINGLPHSSDKILFELNQCITEMQYGENLEDISHSALQAIQKLSGFDRVLLYRFTDNDEGEVIQECIAQDWPANHIYVPLPAHHFPAPCSNDIIDDHWLPMRDSGVSNWPIFQGRADIQSGMSILVVQNNALWGGIVGQHRQPSNVELPTKLTIKTIARSFALRISTLINKGSFENIINQAKEMKGKLASAQEQMKLLSLAVEQSPHMVVVTDIEQKIISVNSAFTWQTGVPSEQAIGRNPAEILRTGKTPKETYTQLKNALSVGVPWCGKFFNRRIDNSEFISSANIWPIRDDNGKTTHYLSIQEDVTKQVQIAEELEAAKIAAEDSARAKGEFLANMSHEIRTPLNAIIGFTWSLRRELVEPLQLEKLDKINQSANHLLRIINNVLDISKIESGKMSLSPENFSLKRLFADVVSQVSTKAEEQGTNIIVDIHKNVPDMLYGDALRISQCLINYAGNAVKFTKHGTVTIHASVEQQEADCLQIRFAVKDTGIGISPDALARLFTTFEQADKSTTRKYGGTGLGLALNKQLAELMGGTVGAESTPQEGSCFWFTAKIAKAAEASDNSTLPNEIKNPAHILLDKYRNLRILLAEDVALNREVVIDILNEAGLTADIAENGSEALCMSKNKEYDLILMDMQMPIMDGITSTIEIRKTTKNSSTNIIALTANAFNDDRDACFNAGMNGFVSKPIVPETLYTEILKCIPSPPDSSEMPMPKQHENTTKTPNFKDIESAFSDNSDIDLSKIPSYKSKPERYIKYFMTYKSSFQNSICEFNALIDSGEMDDARRKVHSLKGSSGQLGIVGIQMLAADLETSIKSGAPISDVASKAKILGDRLSIVCRAISNLCADGETK